MFKLLAITLGLILAAPLLAWSGLPQAERPADPESCAFGACLDTARRLLNEWAVETAEKFARQLLTRVEAEYGSDSLQTAEVSRVLVQVLERRSWSGVVTGLEREAEEQEALRLASRALVIQESSLGPGHTEVGDTLVALGRIQTARRQFEAAMKSFERALAIYEQQDDRDPFRIARALHNQSRLLHREGSWKLASPLLDRAVTIVGGLEDRDDAELADLLEGLAVMIAETGSGHDYMALYRRSLVISERVFGPDHIWTANTYFNLGYELYHLGEWEEAKIFMERAIEIRQAAPEGQQGGVAMALANYALLLRAMGYVEEALSTWQRSLALGRRALGADDPRLAIVMGDYAMALQRQGDYIGARALLEDALASSEAARGPDHPEVGWHLLRLAELLVALGDYAEAAGLQNRAIDLFERQLTPEHWLWLETLIGLGEQYEKAGFFEEARQTYRRTLVLDSTGSRAPATLRHLADLERRLGDPEAARRLFDESLAALEASPHSDPSELAEILLGRSRLEADLGDYGEALRLGRRALGLRQTELPRSHPEIGRLLAGLATYEFEAGNLSQAFEEARRSEESSREHFRLTIRGLSERESLRYASARTSGLDLMLTLAVDTGRRDWGSVAYDSLIRSRALILDESARRHQSVSGVRDPELANLQEALDSRRNRLAHLVVAGPDEEHPETYRRMVEHARREKEVAERELAAASARFRRSRESDTGGLEEVTAALPPRSALVGYARYDHHRAGSDPIPSYLAVVLSDESSRPVLVPLGPAAPIESQVERLSRQIGETATAPSRGLRRAETAYRRIALSLAQSLWGSIKEHLEGAEKVFIVPDAALNLVHFAALPCSNGLYLIDEGPMIHYLSAERDLMGIAEAPVGRGLLALGDPAFDETRALTAPAAVMRGSPLRTADRPTFRGQRSSCGEFRDLRFRNLPASAIELEEIAAVWGATGVAGGAQPQEPPRVVLKGPRANEWAFKVGAGGKRVLHLATHGFFLGGSCRSGLDSQRTQGLDAGQRSAVPEQPLLLSGLALAGANRRSAVGQEHEDGILTAEEIAAQDLSATEWAVLSACESGLGEIRAGEGVFGLRRAFRVAGTRTVIMSLWPVDDEASRQWMQRLYQQRMLARLPTVDAVHQASLEMLHHRRAAGQSTHPFYWAGFVASGDWR